MSGWIRAKYRRTPGARTPFQINARLEQGIEAHLARTGRTWKRLTLRDREHVVDLVLNEQLPPLEASIWRASYALADLFIMKGRPRPVEEEEETS